MSIWITSDWHFNHPKSFIYEPRGFNSVEEMNEGIIERYNSVVNKDDIVYCLGDCCLGGAENLNKNKELIERLNGNLIIITGNHCTNQRIKMYKTCKNIQEVISYATVIKYKKYSFYLSHFPSLTANYTDGKTLRTKLPCLCGHYHTHDRWADWDKGIIFHCEVDANNCYPFLLDNIIEEIKNRL